MYRRDVGKSVCVDVGSFVDKSCKDWGQVRNFREERNLSTIRPDATHRLAHTIFNSLSA